MKKFKTKKSLKLKLISTALLFTLAGATFTGCAAETTYEQKNESLSHDSVLDRINYWGGDARYINQNYNPLLFRDSHLAAHFGNKGRPIVVGYTSKCTNNEIIQFDYVVKYYNTLFQVINPNYSFKTIQCNDQSQCDIFVDFAPLKNSVGASVNCIRDSLNACIVEKANITVNSMVESSNTALRLYLAHEFMHIFYGSDDINETQSKTFSVYNSGDVGFMVSQIEKTDALTQSQKDTFVTLAPTDVATLIAIYGNHQSDEAHNNYVDLLEVTLEMCSMVYGDFQPYFKNGYTLPEKKVLYSTADSKKEF